MPSYAFIGVGELTGSWNPATNSGSLNSGFTLERSGGLGTNIFAHSASAPKGTGGYHASTNLTASTGDYWEVANTADFTLDENRSFSKLDWVVFDGEKWVRISNSDKVGSVMLGNTTNELTVISNGLDIEYGLNVNTVDGNNDFTVNAQGVEKALWVDASANYVIMGTGSTNVGIGTATPNAELHVIVPAATPAHSTNAVLIGEGTSNGDMELRLGVNDSSGGAGWLSAINRGTGAIPLVLQGTGGNVGIGTSTATHLLTVSGDISGSSVSVGDNLLVHGDVGVTGSLTVAGTSTHDHLSASSLTVGQSLLVHEDVGVTGSLTVAGNLTVNGTTTSIQTTNSIVKDTLIELNNGAGSNSNDCGIVIERGSTGDNAIFMWDESADTFVVGTTTATGDSTGNLTVTVADFQASHLSASSAVLGESLLVQEDVGITGSLTVAGSITGGTYTHISGSSAAFGQSLLVHDDANITGSLTVAGSITGGTFAHISGSSAAFGQSILVHDDANITGSVNVGENVDIAGDIDVDGTTNLDNTDIDGTLVVDGSNISLDSTSTLNIDNSNTSNGITIGTATSGVPISIGHTTSETTVNDNLSVTGDFAVDGTANLDNTDIDGTLVVDGSNISLDSTSTLNIDNSNTSNGITIGTATSGVPISIGHSTSETTVNDNLSVTGDFAVDGTANLDNTDIDGTLVVDGSNISLDSTSTFNIDCSNTSNGVTIATATSGVPISIGHSTSETTVNDNLTVTGQLSGSSATLGQSLLVHEDVGVTGSLVVKGTITGTAFGHISGSSAAFGQSLLVHDDANITGSVNISGSIKTGGTITLKDQGGAAATPADGYGVLYNHGDNLYFKNDSGTAIQIGSGGGNTEWVREGDAAGVVNFTGSLQTTGSVIVGDTLSASNAQIGGELLVHQDAGITGSLTVTGSVLGSSVGYTNLVGNPSTMRSDLTILENYNAVLYGPITIQADKTMTIPSDSTVKIVNISDV